jgi:TonB-dependent starch-binding outer membrane protein SusC
MKITILLLFLGVMNMLASPTYSQNTKISLDLRNTPIENVLDKIEQESEFYFLYNQKLIDVERKVDIMAENKPIKEILNNLFEGTDVQYAVLDRQIILTNIGAPGIAIAIQQLQVSGKVIDAASGQPLPGVNVIVSGTTTGVLTDVDGVFSINLSNPNATLEFTFIGYNKIVMPVQGRTTFNISMVESITTLDEIVVVGYGTQKRATLPAL